MTKVKVKLFASFRELLPDQPLGESSVIELPDSALVSDLVRRLSIPEARLIFVNGVARGSEQHVLKEGDEIGVFPLLGGG
ncbi:MAG: MoaD/ThiS family protein [Planctomycetes bacterium]|nr:MoaD/ThiS family protein [Planctomycetota bacterium]